MSEMKDSSQQEKDINDPLSPIEKIEKKDNNLYNCDECSSLIEISSINENDNMIVFKCQNKEKRHEKQIKIKDYLEKMIQYNNKSLNEDVCPIHSDSENKNKYESYCFDCNRHLCRKCLKDRTHLTHYKNNIIEIQPIQEECDIVKEIIDDYDCKINNLKIEKTNTIKELEELLHNNINKQKDLINKSKELCIDNKNKELSKNNEMYIQEIKELKKKYEEELKKIIEKYNKNNKKINNKYKLINEENNIFHNYTIDELNKQFEMDKKNLPFDNSIENMNNLKIIIEKIYKTYMLNSDNYFNAINMNNILLSYNKKEYLENNIMKKVVKNNYEDTEKLIFQRKDEKENKYLQTNKEKDKNINITYLNKLQNYLINDKNENKEIKDKIINIFEKIYNVGNYKEIEKNLNEPILIFMIQNIIKTLEELDSDNQINNEIKNIEINDEKPLYEIYINKILGTIKKKFYKSKGAYNILEKELQNKENKFIPYEQLEKKINDTKKDIEDEKTKKDIQNMITYCLLYLNEKNENTYLNISKIISELKQLKEIEGKDINLLDLTNTCPIQNKKIELKNLTKKRIKKNLDIVGMRNLGNTCYINTIIQLLFMITNFKYSIIDANDNKEPIKNELLDDDNFLHQLQKIFTYLLFTSYGEVIPKDFIISSKTINGLTKDSKDFNKMGDCQEYFINICDKIEKSLNNTKYKYLIENLFLGKICHRKKCNSCNIINYDFEQFNQISLEIKNLNNIYESLDNYISEEIIDDFECSNCEKKVQLKKNSLISSLPNILVIHLKRITYNLEGKLEKIYSKFEFPKILNLKKYCIENITNENENIYKKKDDYYVYNLKCVIIHKGGAEGGHYINIIKDDKDKWYKFDDSKIKDFDIQNLEEQCFGGENQTIKEPKKYSAYLLFYELSKKKPIKILLSPNEIEKEKVIEYNKDNLNKIEKEYDITKLEDAKDEEELKNTIFHNTEENSYYKYIPYDDNPKNVVKEYFGEVLRDNKIYDYLYGKNKIISFNSPLIQILMGVINNESFSIKDLKFEEYKNLMNIFIELIISYISDENNFNDVNKKYFQNVNKILDKIFLFLFLKENEQLFNNKYRQELFNIIYNDLILNNIKILFLYPTEEISQKLYQIVLNLIKQNVVDNKKLLESISEIINDGDNISLYLYKILYELIQKNDDNDRNCKLFLMLYSKLFNEIKENSNEIIKILKYFIYCKKVLSNKETIDSIKKQNNEFIIKKLFDEYHDILILLNKHLQYNDQNYSQTFNFNEIQKLYIYCLKKQDNKSIRENQIKLIKFIFSILQINDKYTPNRIKFLLGYPQLIFRKDAKNNMSLFGVNIMDNDINTEIFEYISNNNKKKHNSVLSLLFPSSYEKNEDNKLEENDKNDLIYELINICLGLNEIKEGNYFLFKTIYLMQSRSIKYDNLYEEMKEILKKANMSNNNKYDLLKIQNAEKECINLVNYEINNTIYQIKMSYSKDPKNFAIEEDKQNIMKTKPKLPDRFKSSEIIIDEKINKDFLGNICDIIPHEIGQIHIKLIVNNTSKNIKILRFEFYTTFFTKKDLKTLTNEKCEFTYKMIKRDIKYTENINININKDKYIIYDFSNFKNKTSSELFSYIFKSITEEKDIIFDNKEVRENKVIKSTIIRDYIFSEAKIGIKIDLNQNELNKDIQNNYYLPEVIRDLIEEKEIRNIFNIYRIKKDLKFLNIDDLKYNMKTIKGTKYIKDYLE